MQRYRMHLRELIAAKDERSKSAQKDHEQAKSAESDQEEAESAARDRDEAIPDHLVDQESSAKPADFRELDDVVD